MPLSRAWKTGRRVYVRCASQSKLNNCLHALRPAWDADEDARRVAEDRAAARVTLRYGPPPCTTAS